MRGEVVFDLETKKSFEEVGGKHNLHLLEVSVAGIYQYHNNKWYTFEEHQLSELESLFMSATRIIGFNIKGFDMHVLKPYLKIPITHFPLLDLMEVVERTLGFRMSLQNLALTTLGESKSASGLDALHWWKEGKVDLIKMYCLQDVRITRDLYEFGRRYGYIWCQLHNGEKMKIPVLWKPL